MAAELLTKFKDITPDGSVPLHNQRELARGVERDVKRVHEDVGVLSQLGLLERTPSGGVVCPFVEMHIDMCLKAA